MKIKKCKYETAECVFTLFFLCLYVSALIFSIVKLISEDLYVLLLLPIFGLLTPFILYISSYFITDDGIPIS